MHIEDLENPSKVRSPGGNFFFVVLCMDMLGNHISFFLLGNLPLDILYSPDQVAKSVKEVSKGYVVGVTHAFSRVIA